MPDLREEKNITIISNRNRVEIRVNRILYVLSVGKKVEIHVFGGKVYDTRMSLAELQTLLGDGFLKVHRGCIVAVKAVHDVSDRIILVNGETLEFTARKKKQILELLHSKRKHIISSLSGDGAPGTEEEYRELMADLKRTVCSGGVVYAAFDHGWLKGFVSVEGRLFGSSGQYLDLTNIHVSEDMRKQGSGKALFEAAKIWGKEHAAK